MRTETEFPLTIGGGQAINPDYPLEPHQMEPPDKKKKASPRTAKQQLEDADKHRKALLARVEREADALLVKAADVWADASQKARDQFTKTTGKFKSNGG